MTVVRFHSTSTSGLLGDYNHSQRQTHASLFKPRPINNEQLHLTHLLADNNAFIQSLPSISGPQSINKQTEHPNPTQSINQFIILACLFSFHRFLLCFRCTRCICSDKNASSQKSSIQHSIFMASLLLVSFESRFQFSPLGTFLLSLRCVQYFLSSFGALSFWFYIFHR